MTPHLRAIRDGGNLDKESRVPVVEAEKKCAENSILPAYGLTDIRETTSERQYLGVKVRMPVKEMLHKIRTAKDSFPNNIQGSETEHQEITKQRKQKRTSYSRGRQQGKYQLVSTDVSLVCTLETLHPDNNNSDKLLYIKNTFNNLQPSSATHVCNFENLHLYFPDGFQEETDIHLNCFGKPKVIGSANQNAEFFSVFQFQVMCEEYILQKTISDDNILEMDEKGNWFLHMAVIEGKRARAYALAKRLVSSNKIHMKNAKKQTALHMAAEKNQYLIFKDLLSFGADINERDNLGKTPLHLCAEYGCVNVIKVLKENMENGHNIQVEAFDNSGLTPLHYAVLAHNATAKEFAKQHLSIDVKQCLGSRKQRLLEGIKYLLKMGADPLTREPKSGKTSFHLANLENNTEIASFFHTLYPNMQETLNENYTLYNLVQTVFEESLLRQQDSSSI
ncbi:NF-kappa-B inhibitor zeta-like [Rhinophrynus dorsalis]